MTKIDVVSGFLGAGKTTLIKKLLKEALDGSKTVLIENEFGEIGIDGGFLKESGIEIKEMNSGCICCSLVGDFGTSLKEVISTYAPERILIEPSGVGKLSDVLKAVENVAGDLDVEINSAVAVVDASKCKMYMKNFGEFFSNQIEYAGTIILSRTDKVDQAKLNACVEMIREHNDKATIITTPLAQLDGKEVLGTIEGADKLEDMMKEMLEHIHDDHDEDECCGHDHDHEHHHHDHDHDDHDHECCCGHHHDDDEDEHEHHHHHDHDEDEHEHHHHHDGECGCGHDHHHHDDNDHDEHEHHEHSHEHGHEHGGANKGKKLMIRVATAVALLALGLVSKTNLGETHWATIVVFIAAYLVAGYDVLWRAICNIRHGEVFDENFLMTVASVGAMCVAEYAEGVAVMVLYQIGEYFQDKAVDKSRESITKLMDIRPDYANLVDGNDSRRVSPERVRVGDIILVKPGEKIPLDGVVIEGNSSLNTTALTGESLPRDVKEGDQVLSGCVNLSGVMKVKVTVGYGESTVAKILALVESSGDAKAKTERFITKFSRIYTPAVCFFALALAIIPSLFDGNWTNWIYTALTFLVISCPCALVISVPLTFFSGIGGASKKGILIKGATYLETLAGLDTVVFDKTGTLTKGTFSVTGVHPAKGVTKDELLDAAAHAEAFSDHPIAISIKEALGRAVDMNRVSDASEAAGHGVQAKVDGQQVYAGNARLMESIGVKAAEPAEIGTVVHVARGGQYLGALVISDVIKENSASAMEALKSAGVKRLVMLTGDRQEVAADIAKKVGLTDYRAELLPEDKVSALEGLLGNGHTVAFTGDGINDAPVLRRADIGIAMGGVGADAAIEAADIVLMDDDPAKIAQGVRHARRTMRIVHQNIIFALAVKLLVMVLGICGFANMWLAVFADVGVAMLAILNAMRAMKMKQ